MPIFREVTCLDFYGRMRELVLIADLFCFLKYMLVGLSVRPDVNHKTVFFFADSPNMKVGYFFN